MRIIVRTALAAILCIAGLAMWGLLTPSITHTFTVTVNRPVTAVFTTMADVRQMPGWVRSLERVEPVGRPLFPGMPTSSYDLHYSRGTLGRTYRLDIQGIDPLVSVSIRLHNASATLYSVVVMRPEGEATTLDVTMKASGNSLLTRMFLPLARWKVAGESEENFQRLKSLLEGA